MPPICLGYVKREAVRLLFAQCRDLGALRVPRFAIGPTLSRISTRSPWRGDLRKTGATEERKDECLGARYNYWGTASLSEGLSFVSRASRRFPFVLFPTLSPFLFRSLFPPLLFTPRPDSFHIMDHPRSPLLSLSLVFPLPFLPVTHILAMQPLRLYGGAQNLGFSWQGRPAKNHGRV